MTRNEMPTVSAWTTERVQALLEDRAERHQAEIARAAAERDAALARAEKAEAEVARLRGALERVAAEQCGTCRITDDFGVKVALAQEPGAQREGEA